MRSAARRAAQETRDSPWGGGLFRKAGRERDGLSRLSFQADGGRLRVDIQRNCRGTLWPIVTKKTWAWSQRPCVRFWFFQCSVVLFFIL